VCLVLCPIDTICDIYDAYLYVDNAHTEMHTDVKKPRFEILKHIVLSGFNLILKINRSGFFFFNPFPNLREEGKFLALS